MRTRKMIEVEPGIFRPAGALGPLTDETGEVIARAEWPHMSEGVDMTTNQKAHLESVAQETK